MENRSLLLCNKIDIAPRITIRAPTVRDILENEQYYYSIASALTATPGSYMVQLHDMGMDFTQISDYELFLMLFNWYKSHDLSLIFDHLDMNEFKLCVNDQNEEMVLFHQESDITIDKLVYQNIVDTIRKINNFDVPQIKPGNEEAKRYLLEKERKRQKRNANKPYEPYLEKLIIALVNRKEFKYNYEEVMDLSIYKFNQSFRQIQTGITFDHTMIGVYAGTLDTSKLADRSCLSWITN